MTPQDIIQEFGLENSTDPHDYLIAADLAEDQGLESFAQFLRWEATQLGKHRHYAQTGYGIPYRRQGGLETAANDLEQIPSGAGVGYGIGYGDQTVMGAGLGGGVGYGLAGGHEGFVVKTGGYGITYSTYEREPDDHFFVDPNCEYLVYDYGLAQWSNGSGTGNILGHGHSSHHDPNRALQQWGHYFYRVEPDQPHADDRWRPCRQSPPAQRVWVLTLTVVDGQVQQIERMYYHDPYWFDRHHRLADPLPTHWTPLPASADTRVQFGRLFL